MTSPAGSLLRASIVAATVSIGSALLAAIVPDTLGHAPRPLNLSGWFMGISVVLAPVGLGLAVAGRASVPAIDRRDPYDPARITEREAGLRIARRALVLSTSLALGLGAYWLVWFVGHCC